MTNSNSGSDVGKLLKLTFEPEPDTVNVPLLTVGVPEIVASESVVRDSTLNRHRIIITNAMYNINIVGSVCRRSVEIRVVALTVYAVVGSCWTLSTKTSISVTSRTDLDIVNAVVEPSPLKESLEVPMLTYLLSGFTQVCH